VLSAGNAVRTGPVVLALMLAGAAWASAAEPARLEVLGYAGPVPGEWKREQPSSPMRLAQFRLPGESEAYLIVYFFGAGQGGSVERNVARWTSQFSAPAGGRVSPEVEVRREANPRVTTVRLQGDYRRGVGAAGGAPVLRDHVLVVGIIETPRGTAFAQLYGPRGSVDGHDAAFAVFLDGLAPR
jgi:hypothetical protein